jgi:hypothetical protein
LADEDHLIAMYDAAMAAAPALARSLRRLRRDHAAHRTALLAAGARAAGAAPIPTPTAAAPARGAVATLRALSAAERAAAAARTAACLAAPRSLAPLFGSIAASEAAHAVAIRA